MGRGGGPASNCPGEEVDRFSLHGLKHRGITDTKGNKGDKRTASGHKTEQALNGYDHEVPTVDPADAPELQNRTQKV